jgi:hypothetical protein
MKTLPILLTLILMISCTRTLPSQNKDSSIPIVKIPPISNQTAESNPSLPDEIVAVVSVKAPAFSAPEKVSMEDLSGKEKLNRLKKIGLYDLEKQQIAKDDLEIRVWQISGLFMSAYKDLAVKESVFILRRTNGNWSGKVFRNTVKGNSPAEKQIKTNLDVPKSGWDNVWQNLLDAELITFLDSVNGEFESATDALTLIIESKVNEIFKAYVYAGNGKVREVRHTAKILNIIAEEFDLEDFKATKQFE